MKWRKDKPQVKDPTWIFSTWPIPKWSSPLPFLITGKDETSMRDIADFVYEGPADFPKLQQCLDRFDAIGDVLLIRDGSFVLPRPLHIGARIKVTITGTRFITHPQGPSLDISPKGSSVVVGNLFA